MAGGFQLLDGVFIVGFVRRSAATQFLFPPVLHNNSVLSFKKLTSTTGAAKQKDHFRYKEAYYFCVVYTAAIISSGVEKPGVRRAAGRTDHYSAAFSVMRWIRRCCDC